MISQINTLVVTAAESTGFDWLPMVVYGVSTLITLLVSLGVGNWVRLKLNELFDYLAMKTKLGFLANVDEILVGFAIALYKGEIKMLKASGSWDKKTGEKMLHVLKTQGANHFGFKALSKVVAGGRITEDIDVDEFLTGRAEAAIVEAKSRGRAAKANPIAA